MKNCFPLMVAGPFDRSALELLSELMAGAFLLLVLIQLINLFIVSRATEITRFDSIVSIMVCLTAGIYLAVHTLDITNEGTKLANWNYLLRQGAYNYFRTLPFTLIGILLPPLVRHFRIPSKPVKHEILDQSSGRIAQIYLLKYGIAVTLPIIAGIFLALYCIDIARQGDDLHWSEHLKNGVQVYFGAITLTTVLAMIGFGSGLCQHKADPEIEN